MWGRSTVDRRFKRRRYKRIVRSDPEELKVQNVEIVSKLNTLMIEKLPIKAEGFFVYKCP